MVLKKITCLFYYLHYAIATELFNFTPEAILCTIKNKQKTYSKKQLIGC